MTKDDQWCELCGQKMKNDVVIIKGRKLEVCNHCKSLCDIDES